MNGPTASAHTGVCLRTSAFSAVPISSLRSFDYGGELYQKCIGDIGECSQRRTFGSPFQLAYISFGIPEGIRQFQLTPASVDTQLGELRTHGVT